MSFYIGKIPGFIPDGVQYPTTAADGGGISVK